ncbi:DEAD/DEAH box helicase [Halodurantibacterium flavum]|uniref:DEAD/DEAH box helicase n=1 Tax=Halodurantibacterium flavum TaxID=1382802 RepID=A0ABW4S298_9RHOB
MTDFETLGLHPTLLKALSRQNLTTPTPIQTQAIPHVMEGRDLMGLAQTGTGKTAAFGLPLLHRLIQIGKAPQPRTVRALILAPTRELVNQIADNLGNFGQGSHIRLTVVVGGASINKQAERLARGTDVLVATPGRLLDLLERGSLTLAETRYLVLDEADQMLDLGFIHALRRIARLLPEKRQTLLFSATMPKQMEELASTYLRDPVRVQVSPPGKTADKITQGVHYTPQGDKATLLRSYLEKHPDEQALVFSRTKHGAEKLMKLLTNWGFNAGSIHGNKSQGQRERTLAAFRASEMMVLVATDVAARGIDIPGVRHVYNYDLPNVPENYVHRIGRTARAGASGRAVAFCAPAEIGELRAIEKLTGVGLPILGGEHMAVMAEPAPRPGRRSGPPRGGQKQGQKPKSGQKSGGFGGKAGGSGQGGKPAAGAGAGFGGGAGAGAKPGQKVRHRSSSRNGAAGGSGSGRPARQSA